MNRLLATCVCISLLSAARPAHADEFFFLDVDKILEQFDGMTAALEIAVDNMDEDEDARKEALQRLEDVIARLNAVSEQLQPPGKWYQANLQDCSSVCKKLGKKSKQSKEKAQCASGENRFASAAGKIVYTYGTWGGMRQSFKTTSEGVFCYGPGQPKDFDLTDRTVACFCGK